MECDDGLGLRLDVWSGPGCFLGVDLDGWPGGVEEQRGLGFDIVRE
jgi:hypothetical protein